MPAVTEAAKIESPKDAGRPQYRGGMRPTEDAGRRRFAAASGAAGVLLEALRLACPCSPAVPPRQKERRARSLLRALPFEMPCGGHLRQPPPSADDAPVPRPPAGRWAGLSSGLDRPGLLPAAGSARRRSTTDRSSTTDSGRRGRCRGRSGPRRRDHLRERSSRRAASCEGRCGRRSSCPSRSRRARDLR